ncbi:MAG: HD domain-containing phosphohydrolase [Candidatus Sedimenticola sp. 20ELBAFRAG]
MTSATTTPQTGETQIAGMKPRLVHGAKNSRSQLDKKARYVLIVDDQTTGRRILEQIIHTIDPKLRIVSFADPREALVQSREETPDLVLTDYRMPEMNGVEFIKRMRALPACKDVPVVMITVVGDRSVRYEALNAGATDFLTRPMDQYECRTRCRNLLQLRQQQCIIQDHAEWLEKQVVIATHQILLRERETLLRLARAGEYRDEDTGNHVLRMAKYSRLIAEYMGLPEADCDEIEFASPMHDIGKIGVPDHILLKPGKLTRDEMELMKQHTVIGQNILNDSDSRFIELGAVIALNHHEKFDGTGYPNGLSGDEIPLKARIVAVADVYDALRSQRPYKKAWSRQDAIAFIIEQSGKHFDPACVDAFINQLDQVYTFEERLSDTADVKNI